MLLSVLMVVCFLLSVCMTKEPVVLEVILAAIPCRVWRDTLGGGSVHSHSDSLAGNTILRSGDVKDPYA